MLGVSFISDLVRPVDTAAEVDDLILSPNSDLSSDAVAFVTTERPTTGAVQVSAAVWHDGANFDAPNMTLR